MNLLNRNLNRLISMFAVLVILVYVIPFNAYALNDYVVIENPYGKVYLPFAEEIEHNGGGYWASPQWLGLRFSLIKKNGDTQKSVDVFNMHSITGMTQGIRETDEPNAPLIKSETISGETGQILNNRNYDFRIFNNSKIEVFRMSDEQLYNFSRDMSWDRSATWYCSDYETVFKHTNVYWDFDINVASGGSGYFKGWAIPDAIDRFIYKYITGKERTALTPEILLETDENSTAWFGMCDLLYALELPIDDGLNGNWEYLDFNRLDGKTKSILYNNIIKSFVIPEYCIVVEPVMFFCVPLFENMGVDRRGNIIWQYHSTAVYYGSATELALLEANGWVAPEDGVFHSKSQYMSFSELHEGVFTRCFGQQCARVTEEYAYDLEKCSMGGLLRIATLDDFVEWKNNNQHRFLDESYDFTAYNKDIIKNYAIGMSIITSTDFIKPQVETYDSEYRTDTNVVTSLKVSNRSDTNYTTLLNPLDSTSVTSNTALNSNGIPKAMLCKFTVSKISDSTGDYGRWTADRAAITTQYQQKLEELGFAKDADGNYITKFYGSLDGIMPREYSDAQPTCYVSFNWKTPEKPCKVTFEVEFLNANSNAEPVLGTDEHDGLRATEIDDDMRDLYGKYVTYFYCDIVEGANTTLFTEDTVPPDSVAIISVSPNAAPDSDEQALYDINKGIYDTYQVAHGTNAAVYTGTDFAGKTIIDTQSWSEYVASYDASGAITLTHKPHTVSIGLSKTTDTTYTDDTSTILRTDQSGLYADYADTIGSGYGIGIDFISSFSGDEAGDNYSRDVTVNGVTYENSLVTNYDHGVVMFPEYSYQTYYGELLEFDTDVDLVGRSSESRYLLTANAGSKFYDGAIERPAGMTDEEYVVYSEMNQSEKCRVHFTPVWYPDGKYQIVLCMFDAWTPAGELWFYKTYDIEIKGSIYDTWYVTRTYKNQVTS